MSQTDKKPAHKPAPKILSISWGHISVSTLTSNPIPNSTTTTSDTPKTNPPTTAKDIKLFPGGSRAWDWSETGTRHQPGIQPGDVEELISHGATTVVLSRGMDMKLHVDPATLTTLKAKGVEVHVAETREAVEIYNDLVEQGTAVGGLFHSTC